MFPYTPAGKSTRGSSVLQKRNRYCYDRRTATAELGQSQGRLVAPHITAVVVVVVVTMVVMSQLYLCDEPYWSRFHVTEPHPTPSIHVISDGKRIKMCRAMQWQLWPLRFYFIFPSPFCSKKSQNWHTHQIKMKLFRRVFSFTLLLKGYEIKDCGNWNSEIYNTNVNFLEKLKQQVEDGYLNYPKFDNWNISKNLPHW